ncbi:hypothetical protein BKA70DRAFT_1218489 [Coprinopsis sp. MPI-PUGE-AT-0042]|nr:hypothetical protein BKA70DRAFT_1218489 [Coprinopsis sp. MPI-PUGE-AT-0042]
MATHRKESIGTKPLPLPALRGRKARTSFALPPPNLAEENIESDIEDKFQGRTPVDVPATTGDSDSEMPDDDAKRNRKSLGGKSDGESPPGPPVLERKDAFDALEGYMKADSDPDNGFPSLDHLSVSDRHFAEHLRLLKWYQEDLRSQRVAFARIKTMLTRDLEAIDRAIWARDEEDKWRTEKRAEEWSKDLGEEREWSKYKPRK